MVQAAWEWKPRSSEIKSFSSKIAHRFLEFHIAHARWPNLSVSSRSKRQPHPVVVKRVRVPARLTSPLGGPLPTAAPFWKTMYFIVPLIRELNIGGKPGSSVIVAQTSPAITHVIRWFSALEDCCFRFNVLKIRRLELSMSIWLTLLANFLPRSLKMSRKTYRCLLVFVLFRHTLLLVRWFIRE